MTASELLARTRPWLVPALVVGLIVGLLAAVTASLATRYYEAEVTLLVGPTNASLNTQRAAGQLALTYAEIAESETLRERIITTVAERTGTSVDIVSQADDVTAGANDVTRIIRIVVRHEDPIIASELATALSAELDRIADEPVPVDPDQIDPAAGETPVVVRPEGAISVIDAAARSDQPVGLRPLGAGVPAAIAATLAVGALQLSRLSRRPTIWSTANLRNRGIHVDAEVSTRPPLDLGQRAELLSLTGMANMRSPKTRTLLVCPVQTNRRAPEFAVQLGDALARVGERVTLLNEFPVGSLERPGNWLETYEHDTAVILESDDHVAVRYQFADDGLNEWLDERRDDHTMVVIAAPPMATSAISQAWASVADQIVLVASRDAATNDQVTEAITIASELSAQTPILVFDTYLPSPLSRLLGRRGLGPGRGERGSRPMAEVPARRVTGPAGSGNVLVDVSDSSTKTRSKTGGSPPSASSTKSQNSSKSSPKSAKPSPRSSSKSGGKTKAQRGSTAKPGRAFQEQTSRTTG